MSTEELKANLRRVHDEAWHKGNLDALDELYAADWVCHRSPYLDFEGLEAYKQHITNCRISYPDLQLTFDEIISEGDTSAVQWTYRGTQTGQSPTTGAPPTGKQVAFMGCTVHHWVAGKIVEEVEIADWLSLLQQLGMVFPMGQSGE